MPELSELLQGLVKQVATVIGCPYFSSETHCFSLVSVLKSLQVNEKSSNVQDVLQHSIDSMKYANSAILVDEMARFRIHRYLACGTNHSVCSKHKSAINFYSAHLLSHTGSVF